MLDYYLKFFVEGITKREFAEKLGQAGSIRPGVLVSRLRAEEWIVYRDGVWVLTSAGKRAHARYYGLRF